MVLLLSFALADVINAEPTNCPAGSIGTSSHSGEWCTPDECESDDECLNQPCSVDVGLCVVTTEEQCGGMISDTADCTFTKREVLGKCQTDADCDDGVPCEIADRCSRAGTCGCSTGGSPWFAALVGAMTLLLARLR
jgi:hypothetical protein